MNMTTNTATIFENISKAGAVSPTTLNGLPAMTSLEIAEITGKTHKNVLRDISKMAKALESRGSDLSCQIISTQYTDGRGKTQPLTILDKRRTFVLLSRYSWELSDLIMGRWLELEGSGFTRVSVQASVVHLIERERCPYGDIKKMARRHQRLAALKAR